MTSTNHPESYTAYAFTEKGGGLSKITVPWKDPKDGEVVAKVIACGVCGRYVGRARRRMYRQCQFPLSDNPSSV